MFFCYRSHSSRSFSFFLSDVSFYGSLLSRRSEKRAECHIYKFMQIYHKLFCLFMNTCKARFTAVNLFILNEITLNETYYDDDYT